MHSSRVRPLLMTLRARLPLAILTIALVSGVSSPASARKYTLQELIDRVSRSYAGVQAARENVSSAQAQLAQANGLLWPQGQLTFGITGTPNVKCFGPIQADGTLPPFNPDQ